MIKLKSLLLENIQFKSFDLEYPTLDSLINGVKNGNLLVHSRKGNDNDIENYKYGLDPEVGDTLKSTDSYQTSIEYYGEGPELVFMSDTFDWTKNPNRNHILFIKKEPFIQQSLGNGKVKLFNGKVVSYERSPMADHESVLYREEPSGVETNDWYSNKTVEVVGFVYQSILKNFI